MLNPNRYMAPHVPTMETGTATLGIKSGPPVTQEDKYDENHQHHRNHQRSLHCFHRGPNGHGLIESNHQIDGWID